MLNTEQISKVQDKAKETVRSNLNNVLLSIQQAAQEHFQEIFVICTFDLSNACGSTNNPIAG